MSNKDNINKDVFDLRNENAMELLRKQKKAAIKEEKKAAKEAAKAAKIANMANADGVGKDTEETFSNGKESKKKRSKLKLGLMIFGGTVLTLILVLGITFTVMRITGKNGLYNGASSDGPDFSRNETADSGGENDILHINPDNLGDFIVGDNSETGGEGATGEGAGSTTEAGDNPSRPSNGTSSEVVGDVDNMNIIPAPYGAEGYDIIYRGKKYKYNKDIITLLVLGIDHDGKVEQAKDGISGGQSDAIFLVVMNPHNMVMDVIAVPRDTITKIWVYDEAGNFVQSGNAQICLQHGYGDGMELSNERAKKAIAYLFYDLPIHSVTSLNISAVNDLNDAIGGVTLESLHTFKFNGYSFTKGKAVKIKGGMAHAYVRYRDCNRHNTASERLARQKQYITLFIEQAKKAVAKDLGKVTEVYDIVMDYLVTDLSLDKIVYLASESISYKFGEFVTLQGTLDTSMKYERYNLDEHALQTLIVEKFYEEVK